MTEPKRRNGYYFYKGRQLPSVSTVMKSAGNSEGLIQWACKQGGLGVIWGLSKINNAEALKERLGSSECLEWAIQQARNGLASEGNRVKDFGSRVHAGIESRLKRLDMILEGWGEEEKTALDTFEKFYAEVGFDPIAIEATIFSDIYSYAGRLDLVAEVTQEQAELIRPSLTRGSDDIEPGLLITDFKTGSLYPAKHAVQLAAYRQGYEETYQRKCAGGLVINIERENPGEIKCHYFSSAELDRAFEQGFIPAYRTWMYFDAPKWFLKQENETITETEKLIA